MCPTSLGNLVYSGIFYLFMYRMAYILLCINLKQDKNR